MTQNYKSMLITYQKQGRLNPDAVVFHDIFCTRAAKDMGVQTVWPEHEFIIDLCAELNSQIGWIVKQYGSFVTDGVKVIIGDTVNDCYALIYRVWESQGRVLPAPWNASGIKESGISYVTTSMRLRYNSILLADKALQEHIISTAQKLGYGRQEVERNYDAIVAILPFKPACEMTEEELVLAVTSALVNK